MKERITALEEFGIDNAENEILETVKNLSKNYRGYFSVNRITWDTSIRLYKKHRNTTCFRSPVVKELLKKSLLNDKLDSIEIPTIRNTYDETGKNKDKVTYNNFYRIKDKYLE